MVLSSELVQVPLTDRIEPFAGSLDLPESPSVAGHPNRGLHSLCRRGGDETRGGLHISVRADTRVVRLVTPVSHEPIVCIYEARLHQVLDPNPVASTLPVQCRSRNG